MGGRTSNESKAKYNAKAYDRVNIAIPKGRKAELQAIAERHGQSVNGFINSLIDEALEREKVGAVPAGSPEGIRAGGFGISPIVQKKDSSSRFITQSAPDPKPLPDTSTASSLDADRPYLPIPLWEDDSTPELEEKIIAILKKKGLSIPTVGQYESMSPERQERERTRLFKAREQARQILDEYERRRKGGA